MEQVIEDRLLSSYCTSWSPPYTGSIYQWAADNVELPNSYAITGKFDPTISRYLLPVFDAIQDRNVRQVNFIAAAQIGKTMLSELYMCYLICNDPSPTLRLHPTQEIVDNFNSTRLYPLLKKCEPIKNMLDTDKYSATKNKVIMPHMYILITSAREAMLHGVSISKLLIDEAHLIDQPEAIIKAKTRTAAFPNTKKILITSTPGEENDHLSKECSSGLEYTRAWTCPNGHTQPYKWKAERNDASGSRAGFVYDIHFKSGSLTEWDYEAMGRSTRLECLHCSASIHDTPTEREWLNKNETYVLTRDGGDHSVVTYRCPVFVNKSISFKSATITYLQALREHKQMGTTDALRVFTQQWLGEEWQRARPIEASKVLTAAFSPNEKWDAEVFRTMCVDYQRKHETKFYCVVAFSKNEIRVLDHSFVATWDQIDGIAKKYGIKAPAVAVDSGYNSNEVYEESVRRCEPVQIGKKILMWGWTCLKGDNKPDGYSHTSFNTGAKLKKYYSPEIKVSLNNRQFARLYMWDNFSIKSTLAHIRDGKSDIKLVLPNADADWTEQINAETLEWVTDGRTGLKVQRWVAKHPNNHYLDCMAMSLTMAHIRGVFSVDVIENKANVSGSITKV